ncbi:MAG: DUF424 family protein [DPANN group archaeon]|nr:DUF424 family protein [DPANN group archaeon]
MFFLKTYNTDQGTIIAVCDKDLIGLVFEENNIVLSIDEHFYLGESATIEEILLAIETCFSANITGNKIINALSNIKIINKNDAHTTCGHKHIIIFKI